MPGPGASYATVKDFVLGLYANKEEAGRCCECSKEHLVSTVLHGVRSWHCAACGRLQRSQWLLRTPNVAESAMSWLEPVIDKVVTGIFRKTKLAENDLLHCTDRVLAQSLAHMMGFLDR